MLRVIKWIWDKAEQSGKDKILHQLYYLRTYHIQKAEVEYLRGRLLPKAKEKDDVFMDKKLSPDEHSAIAGELGKILTEIENQQEIENGR